MATLSVAKKYSSIDPEVLRRAMKDVGEDEERREATLAMIREWLKKQPHLNCPPGRCHFCLSLSYCSESDCTTFNLYADDRFFLMYARGCKYSNEKIKRKIDLCLTMRALLPEIFSGWDATSPVIQNALRYG